MAAPSTALDYLSAITQKRIVPFLIDQVSKTNTTLNLLIKNAVFLDGGDYISQPVLTSLPTSAAIAYSGADVIPANFQENEQGAVFDWKFYAISVDITGPDEVRNDGVAAALNLIKLRMQEAEIALRDTLGSNLQGDGTAFGGKAMLGWKAAVDDGSVVDSYGGISRAAYPVWKAFRSANGGVARPLTLSLMDTATQNVSWDADVPNLYVTTPGLLTKFTSLLQPFQRIMGAEVGVSGYKNVFYRGYPIISDMQVQTSPSEIMFGLNTRYIQMYFKRGRFFKWVPFQRQGNQDVITSKILLALCLVVSRPASQFQITDLSSTL